MHTQARVMPLMAGRWFGRIMGGLHILPMGDKARRERRKVARALRVLDDAKLKDRTSLSAFSCSPIIGTDLSLEDWCKKSYYLTPWTWDGRRVVDTLPRIKEEEVTVVGMHLLECWPSACAGGVCRPLRGACAANHHSGSHEGLACHVTVEC